MHGISNSADHETSPISTFEVATNDARHNSRTVFDEFGVDPLQVASRKSDEEMGEYSAHGLRFAINRGDRPAGWDTDIDQTATYVGSDHRSVRSETDAHEMPPRATLDQYSQPEFQEGSSSRQADEFVEGRSSDRA